jgi:hypothetical protein
MTRVQQAGSVPVTGQQAPTVSLQAGTIPATTTTTQLDINSIMNMMIMLMVVVMMMKMMTSATEKI